MKRSGSLMVKQLEFPTVDGGSTPTPLLQKADFNIMSIVPNAAKQWIERWHYSHLMPTGKNICYGLYACGEPYAVIVYGIGVNPYQADYLGVDNVVEIKRLCRSEPRLNGFPLSRFIALTSRWLRKQWNFDCIVAFADPQHGHFGTVYSAAGFKMEGKTNAEWHTVDKEGTIRHRRFAFRHARRNKQDISESRKILGLSRIQTEPKYRWVLRY